MAPARIMFERTRRNIATDSEHVLNLDILLLNSSSFDSLKLAGGVVQKKGPRAAGGHGIVLTLKSIWVFFRESWHTYTDSTTFY